MRALAAYDVAWVADRDAGAKYRPGERGDYYAMLRLPQDVVSVLVESAFMSNPAGGRAARPARRPEGGGRGGGPGHPALPEHARSRVRLHRALPPHRTAVQAGRHAPVRRAPAVSSGPASAQGTLCSTTIPSNTCIDAMGRAPSTKSAPA